MALFGGKLSGAKQMEGQTDARPLRNEPYRGRYRINPDRSVDVWNGSRYVPRTTASLAPEAQALIERERNELDRDNLSVRLGDQFLDLNSRQRTGALWHGNLPFQDGQPITVGDPELQAMANIQNRFVRSQIREGTSGAGNTGPEQQRIERSGPSISNSGPANRTAVLNLRIDRDLRAARLSALEDWSRDPQNRGPEGFEQWWVQNEPRIRDSIQRRYEVTNGPVAEQATEGGFFRGGRQRPNPQGSVAGAIAGRAIGGLRPPQRPPGVPPEAQWNPQTRRWRTP